MSRSFGDIYRGLNYDLIKHYEQGVTDERERIIKLLEEDGERNYISQETFDYVVSVIKGEQ
jgi:hypothetical protein